MMNGECSELSVTFFQKQMCSQHLCEMCTFYDRWERVIKYNLLVGVLSPNLWVYNCVLVGYALVWYRKSGPCSSHAHKEVKQKLQEKLGYSFTGIAMLAVFFGGLCAWIKTH